MTTCPTCSTELERDAAFCGSCGARVRARRTTLVGMQLDGRFQIDAKIAEGGFGTVYRATHLASQRIVALKVLHADLAADANLAARFRREGATLANLKSVHTVETYDVGETEDGTLYIAMELLGGESLLERFRALGPLPWRSVVEIMRAVCLSLGEAHALGIVHRDLKPANIHLEPNDHVKVIDFGIAKLMRGSDIDDGDDLTRIGQAVGTLEYMAPEQLIGGSCDGRSDIYTLGVVAYEMLTGRRPFSDATGPTSLVTALMTRTVPPPSTLFDCPILAPEIDRIVLRCLEREPSDRYATVEKLIADLDVLLHAAQLARGSWSAELVSAEDEKTWVDVMPPVIPQPQASVPRSEPAMQLGGLAHAPTHTYAVGPHTNPGVGPCTPSRLGVAAGPTTPSRFPRGSSTPLGNSSPRAARVIAPITPSLAMTPQNFREPTAPFAVAQGTRVRPVPLSAGTPFPTHVAASSDPPAAPTGSRALFDIPRQAPTTGSLPLVDLGETAAIAPTLPAPAIVRLETQIPTGRTPRVRPLSAARIVMWAIGLLAIGTGAGMIAASLLG